jgi:hypothetical protein
VKWQGGGILYGGEGNSKCVYLSPLLSSSIGNQQRTQVATEFRAITTLASMLRYSTLVLGYSFVRIFPNARQPTQI